MDEKGLAKIWQPVCVVAMLVGVCIALTLTGCSKEKEQEKAKGTPYRASGSCESFDKLPGDIAKPVEINYGGKVKLLGLTANKISPDKIKLSYYWQVLGDMGLYNVVFVHFTDAANTGLFGNDHDFCQRKPFSELKDKFTKETFTVNIPQSAKGQPIYIKVGIYAPEMQSNNRLKIASAGKTPLDDGNTRAIVERINP
jgi:hypothetical protein